MSSTNVFNHNTYIILEFPDAVAAEILSIRSQFDEFRAALPAEITLTGSSGVGVISENQEPETVYSIVNDIAAATAPVEVQFGDVVCFPGTDIYYLSIENDGQIRSLHKHLSQSSIKFEEMPFPYTPHCTISSRDDLSDIEKAKLQSLKITRPFTVDTLTVLSLYRDEERQLHVPVHHRVKLTGK
ncbi:2'-5' RNA ligase family protein [Bacillus sp. AK031]